MFEKLIPAAHSCNSYTECRVQYRADDKTLTAWIYFTYGYSLSRLHYKILHFFITNNESELAKYVNKIRAIMHFYYKLNIEFYN